MMPVFTRWLLLLVFMTSAVTSTHAATYPKERHEKDDLIVSILKLALAKANSNIKLEPLDERMTSTRAVEQVRAGNLDIYWAGTRPDYEETMRPVYIPLFKGLLGHRIFIIEKDKQHLFNNINNLADLKQLKAGQGTTWGDTKALKGAGIPTVTTLKFTNLFYMLEGDRFDYFPRAIHEPWLEVGRFPELNLTVEERILLIYPFAMYFFVNKDNTELHEVLTRGLEAAVADGSYDELFYSNALIKDALTKTKIKDRVVIRIPNPVMGPNTPFDREELWLDLEQQ